jgi:hypothetical protein
VCTAGWGNCDGNAKLNGCETNVYTSSSNCGTCGNVCATGSYCSTGTCAYYASCNALHIAQPALPSGLYTIDPDGIGGAAPFTVYCDMVTDGGGWTIVHAITGADGEQPLTSNTEVAGDPLSWQHYSLNQAKKMAISGVSTQSIFRRNSGVWIKVNSAMFDAALATPNTHMHKAVTVTASDASTAPGYIGYSNFNNSGGGDFNVSTNAVVDGVDHHSTAYYHLNSGCVQHYLYSYSNAVVDGDAGYDVSVTLGAWTATNACQLEEGGGLVFYAAMR